MKTSTSTLNLSLSGNESIVKEMNVENWDAILTSERILLFHSIGFGSKEKVLDAKRSDLESIEEKEDVPWGLYGIGALFTTLFMVPMIVMDKYNFLRGGPYLAYLATPLAFLAGIYVVGRAFFKPKTLVIKVKNSERSVSTPTTLKKFFSDLTEQN